MCRTSKYKGIELNIIKRLSKLLRFFFKVIDNITGEVIINEISSYLITPIR